MSKSHLGYSGPVIKLRADVVRNDEGVVELCVPATPLCDNETDVLAKLFPNTMPQIDELLIREALIAAIIPVRR